MIDLEEPKKAEYTEEEKRVLKEQFILLLHTLLFIYLSLHNFIIPFISNLLTSSPLLADIHFWFLFHIPVQFLLRKKITLPTWFFYFLVLGTFTRLGMEFHLAATLKTWQILSLLLSEISSIIFYFLYFDMLKDKKFTLPSLAALLVIPILSLGEVRSEKKIITKNKIIKEIDSSESGCKGSLTKLNFPIPMERVSTQQVEIKDCGFEESSVRFHKKFRIHNSSLTDVNLRLYQIRVLHGKVSWRFLRLVQVPQNTSWEMDELLEKDDAVYLVKSPERRKIGNLILIPNNQVEFPLGPGELQSTYDTLHWKPYHD